MSQYHLTEWPHSGMAIMFFSLLMHQAVCAITDSISFLATSSTVAGETQTRWCASYFLGKVNAPAWAFTSRVKDSADQLGLQTSM